MSSFAAVVMFGMGVGCCAAAELKIVHPSTNYFADADLVLVFEALSEKALDAKLIWRYEANNRSLAQGEAMLKLLPEEASRIKVKLRLPPVREKVIFQTGIAVELVTEGETIATLQHPLWLFPEDPFVDHKEWLKSLDIALFDPIGDTEKRFDQLDIPYHWLRNLSAVEEVDNGALIIGEGVSLEDDPELGGLLVERAQAGVMVLCLALADGELPQVPLMGESTQRVNWRRADVISDLDKRLDAQAWPNFDSVPFRGLQPVVEDDTSLLRVSGDAAAWPWLDVAFRDSRGRVVYCGFTIVKEWEHGPTPRFLLERIFKHLDGPPTTTQLSTDEE